MEKTIDLITLGVKELEKNKLNAINGGLFEELIPIYARIAIAIDDFMQGFVDGFKDNNYQPE